MANDITTSHGQGEIILYQPSEDIKLEVKLEQDTVWLNRHQIAQLFGRDIKTIGKHISNALHEELSPAIATNATSPAVGANNATTQIPIMPVVAKYATTAADGKTYQVE